MKNENRIIGDKNINIQNSENSKISVKEQKNETKTSKLWLIIPILIALIGLIIQILVGWEQLIPWINAE